MEQGQKKKQKLSHSLSVSIAAGDHRMLSPHGTRSADSNPLHTASKTGLDLIASTTSTSPHRFQLPLRGWAVGLKVMATDEHSPLLVRHSLIWDQEHTCLLLMDTVMEAVIFWTSLGIHTVDSVVAVDLQEPVHHTIVVKIKSSAHMRAKGRYCTALEPGNPGQSGDLMFRFTTNVSEWQPHGYTSLLAHLSRGTSNVRYVAPSTAESLWDRACQPSNPPAGVVHGLDDRSASRAVPQSSSVPGNSIGYTSLIPAVPIDRTIPSTAAHSLSRCSSRASSQESKADTLDSAADISQSPEVLLVYPLAGARAVHITRADCGRLRPGEFLNDTVIEFGLRLFLDELRQRKPEIAEQIHLFNSFFYKKLSENKMTDGYKSVRTWTSKVDIFHKKYIVVPINEDLHWYLAIISHPNYILFPQRGEPSDLQSSASQQGIMESGSPASHITSHSVTSSLDPLATRNPALGSRSTSGAPVSDSCLNDARNSSQGGDNQQPGSTYIFTLDSMGSTHPKVVNRLGAYLKYEAMDKKRFDLEDTGDAHGKTVHVPSQPNYCDCGVYLLHFAKTFFNEPELSRQLMLAQPSNCAGEPPNDHWDDASIPSLREDLSCRIGSLSQQWRRMQDEVRT